MLIIYATQSLQFYTHVLVLQEICVQKWVNELWAVSGYEIQVYR